MGTREEGIGELAEIEAPGSDERDRYEISSHWGRDQQEIALIEELGFSSPMNRLYYVPMNSLVQKTDWTSFLVHRPSPSGDIFGDGSDWFPGEESTGGEGGLSESVDHTLVGDRGRDRDRSDYLESIQVLKE